eukprot:scaffold98964_cov35-Attheya_sp.AAC.1
MSLELVEIVIDDPSTKIVEARGLVSDCNTVVPLEALLLVGGIPSPSDRIAPLTFCVGAIGCRGPSHSLTSRGYANHSREAFRLSKLTRPRAQPLQSTLVIVRCAFTLRIVSCSVTPVWIRRSDDIHSRSECISLFPKNRKLAYDARQQLAQVQNGLLPPSELFMLLEEISRSLDIMENLLSRETPSQREVWRRKILELRDDANS